MPVPPPPVNANQAPVAPPVPNNAAANNPIAAPNQVADLQAPLIPAGAPALAAPVVRREFFLKTYFKNVILARDQLVKDHPLKFLTLILQAAMHNAVTYYLFATWYYLSLCGDEYPYVLDTSSDPEVQGNNKRFNNKL